MKRVLCSHWLHEYGRKAYTSCTPRGNKEKKKITSGQIVMADCRIWYCKVIFHSRVESYREGRNQAILSLLQLVLIKSNSLDYPN